MSLGELIERQALRMLGILGSFLNSLGSRMGLEHTPVEDFALPKTQLAVLA